MKKERGNSYKRQKIFFSIFAVAVIIISIFTVVTYSQMNAISNEIGGKGKDSSVLIVTDKEEGYPPFTVNFSTITTNTYGKLSYEWGFGDGETSEEKNPEHTYTSNESWTCKLTIKTEKGEKITDSVKITSLINQPPKASIVLSSTTPDRDFGWKIPYLILRWGTKTYGGRNLYYMKNMGIAPLSGTKSNIQASALSPDPEGDEIVEYKWILKPPTITLFGNKPIHDDHTYYGKNVTFDLLDIYVTGQYDLILTVKDEAGNIDTEMTSFKVSENPVEQKTFGLVKRQKQQWLTQWSGIDFVRGAVVAAIGWLLYKNMISQKINLPILKLAFMVVLTFLKLNPEDYGDETMTDVLRQILDKYKFTKPIITKLFNTLEKLLIRFGMEDQAEELQIMKEDLGLDNKRPVIQEPFPKNNAENIPRLCPYVSINVTDPEDDEFTVKISGDYVINTTYNSTDVSNNIFNATFNYPTSEGLPAIEAINWNVEAVDQNGKVVTGNYKFTTFA